MSTIVICDHCDNPIEGQPYASLALPGVPGEDQDWVFMDICSKACVYDLFQLGEEEEDVEPEEAPPIPAPEMLKLKPVEEEKPRAFDPDALLDNEKRFKEEAQRISSAATGVKSRTRGER